MPSIRTALVVVALCCVLSACGSPTPVAALPPVPVDTTTPAQRLAAIEHVAGADDTELSVQPLRDAQVDDLRQIAKTKRAAGDLAGAAVALDQALRLVGNDPSLLQERAETALLLGDWMAAERFAKQAVDLGSKTGPLCRRHWATIEQSRLARGETANALSAHSQIAGCTVFGIKRY